MERLVSVIVPVYNVEQYLDQCVESIINQTYKNLEIILVDDDSPDTCPQKCDAWAEKDPRVRVIHKENAGPGYARNSGLDIATGDYIMFADSDDCLAPDAIEVMVEIIERDQSDLVAAQNSKVYGEEKQEQHVEYTQCDICVEKDEAMRMMGSKTKHFPASVWGKLYKREIFERVRFTNLKTAEDTYALPDILDQCEKISITSKVVYYYFQRFGSIIHTMTDEKRLDNIRAVLHVARFLYDRNYVNEARHYYYAAIFNGMEMKNNSEAKELIQNTFHKKEIMLLRRNSSKYTMSMLAYKFPQIYKFFKKLRKAKQ